MELFSRFVIMPMTSRKKRQEYINQIRRRQKSGYTTANSRSETAKAQIGININGAHLQNLNDSAFGWQVRAFGGTQTHIGGANCSASILCAVCENSNGYTAIKSFLPPIMKVAIMASFMSLWYRRRIAESIFGICHKLLFADN